MNYCSLCQSSVLLDCYEDKRRTYLQCQGCELVCVDPEQRLDAKAEKTHHDLYENNPNDEGYRNFLSRIAGSMLKRIEPNSGVLDFGCGSSSTLSLMLEEQRYWSVRMIL